MMTTVKQILEQKGSIFHAVQPTDSVFDALSLMAQFDIGCVLVTDNDKLVGIFTERDYARKVVLKDFEHFHYVIAMDRSNRSDLHELAPSADARRKIELLRNFDPASPRDAEVPDPYYGGGDGFERVLDICEAGCRGLLQYILDNHRL